VRCAKATKTMEGVFEMTMPLTVARTTPRGATA
jgi:hypothetical protein